MSVTVKITELEDLRSVAREMLHTVEPGDPEWFTRLLARALPIVRRRRQWQERTAA